MKRCSKCGTESENFGPYKRNTDGLKSWCRDCHNTQSMEYYKTKKGLSTKIYGQQRESSRQRGHPMPEYTLRDLRERIFSQDDFEILYNNRKESGYNTSLVPSVDRIDDYEGYSFDNIQLMTWKDNQKKSYRDRKSGINTKTAKGVIGTDRIKGHKLEFYSIMEAYRQTSIPHNKINQCCKGKRRSAGGYIWEYIN